MKTILAISAALLVAACAAVVFADTGATTDAAALAVDKGGRTDRPKDPPDNGGGEKRDDRRKPPPRDNGGGDRPPREKGERPSWGRGGGGGYEPVPAPVIPAPGGTYCRHCGMYNCYLDHFYYQERRYGRGPVFSTPVTMYMLGSGTMMFVNLLFSLDENREGGDGSAVAGLALGAGGLAWAFLSDDPQVKNNMLFLGLASAGFAVLNLITEPHPDDPIVEYSRATSSRATAITISF